jgi:hypothetical protein
MTAPTSDGNSNLDNREIPNLLDDNLLEEIRRDLDERFTIAEIRKIALEVSAEFKDAIVTAFLPIFIYRRTREKLQRMLDQS